MKHATWGLSENSSYKIVALLITLILWVIILGSKEAVITKTIETEYLLPKDMVISNTVPHEVAFRVGGPRLALKKFSESTEPLTIDLSSAVEGLTTVRIHPDSINVPPGVRVMTVSPSTITPKLERMITRSVLVEVQTKGQPPFHRKVTGITVDPKSVEISGIRSVIEKIKSVKTEPLDLTRVDSSQGQELSLTVDEPGLYRLSVTKVKVALVIK